LKYRHLPWIWELIEDVPFEYIKKYPDISWNRLNMQPNLDDPNLVVSDWKILSRQTDFATILRYPNLPWNYGSVAKNVSISIIMEHDLPWGKLAVVPDFENLGNRDWDWDFISKTTALDVIMCYINLPWNWKIVTRSVMSKCGWPNYNDIIKYPHLPWDPTTITDTDSSVHVAILKTHLPWDWRLLSRRARPSQVIENPNLPWNWASFSRALLVSHFPDKPFDWKRMSRSDELTEQIFLSNIDKDWDWDIISDHSIMSYSLLGKYDKPWNFHNIKCHPVDVEYVEDHINENWDWRYLSKHMPMEFILQYSNKPWSMAYVALYVDKPHLIQWSDCFGELSRNPNITLEFISHYISENWDWQYLSDSPKITIQFVLNNPTHWNWRHLSRNTNISLQDIIATPHLPWHHSAVIAYRYTFFSP
jgi:hypothetical protein